MSTRGIAIIGNRYFFIRYNAHDAGMWFRAAFRSRPKTIDQFIEFLNLFEGAQFTEFPKERADKFMDEGDCEAVWRIDFTRKKYRKLESNHGPAYYMTLPRKQKETGRKWG